MKRKSSGTRGMICVSCCVLVCGCSTSSSDASATTDAAADAPTEVIAIDPAETTFAFWKTAEPPVEVVERIDYARDTHLARWRVSGGDGSRVLDAADAARIDSALAALTYTTRPRCDGYDGMVVHMTASGGGASSPELVNRWNNCGGAPYVAAGVGPLFDLLDSLNEGAAKPPPPHVLSADASVTPVTGARH